MDDSDEEDLMETAEEAAKPKGLPSGVMELIGLQSANGSFSWGPAIERIVGRSKDEVVKASNGLDEKSWITALAVAVLEAKFGDQRDLWMLVADKAKKFLRKNSIEEELIEKAKAIIGSY